MLCPHNGTATIVTPLQLETGFWEKKSLGISIGRGFRALKRGGGTYSSSVTNQIRLVKIGEDTRIGFLCVSWVLITIVIVIVPRSYKGLRDKCRPFDGFTLHLVHYSDHLPLQLVAQTPVDRTHTFLQRRKQRAEENKGEKQQANKTNQNKKN